MTRYELFLTDVNNAKYLIALDDDLEYLLSEYERLETLNGEEIKKELELNSDVELHDINLYDNENLEFIKGEYIIYLNYKNS